MNPDEEDWGGRIEFGYQDKNFSIEVEDYFLMFEERCSLASHHCAARVSGVALNVRDRVLQPPDYDGMNIVELVDKYGDAHI